MIPWTNSEIREYESVRVKDGLLEVLYTFKKIPVNNPEERARYLYETFAPRNQSSITLKAAAYGRARALACLEEEYIKYLLSQ